MSVIQNGASISNLPGPEAADSEAQSTGSVAGRGIYFAKYYGDGGGDGC